MDIVVTVPKNRWNEWLDEGDLPDEIYSGNRYFFSVGKRCPRSIHPGERVYIVSNEKLRGYAPLLFIHNEWGYYYLVRGGDAVACTINQKIPGFRGFRYRFWEYSEEIQFSEWRLL